MFIVRPDCGVRKLYSVTTSDFKTWSPLIPAVTPDSEDKPLADSYGMPIIAYKGMFIGFLWLYYHPDGNNTKYLGGNVNCRLAYSTDGIYWKRSLRTPFIGNDKGTMTEGMVYPASVIQKEDGSLLLLGHASRNEHGDFNGTDAGILTYKLREDGFIALSCKAEGHFCSAYKIISGGLSINLTAEHATCAILDMDGKPLEGFSHADCRPFSCDSTKWIPDFGHTLTYTKPVMIEINMKNVSLYSITGDFENLTSREASRRR